MIPRGGRTGGFLRLDRVPGTGLIQLPGWKSSRRLAGHKKPRSDGRRSAVMGLDKVTVWSGWDE